MTGLFTLGLSPCTLACVRTLGGGRAVTQRLPRACHPPIPRQHRGGIASTHLNVNVRPPSMIPSSPYHVTPCLPRCARPSTEPPTIHRQGTRVVTQMPVR